MAAISEPLSTVVLQENLRPFDIRRDLGQVADLVELCFAETLDPDGRDYLARMRSAAGNNSLFNIAKSWASAPMNGYIWQEGERIVGNVSLIPYLLQGKRCFLIANVAVHPDYRRRGIGRRLTEKAIEYTRNKHSPSTWLHVREDNQPALQLYQSLGFEEKAVRTTWIAIPDFSPHENPPGLRFISPGSQHWSLIHSWLRRSYPEELTWHMPLNANNLRPGLLGMLSRFLYNAYIQQWGVLQSGRLMAAAAWQATGAYANSLWLAAPLKSNDEPVRALLQHIRWHSPTRRSLALEYPARQYEQAFREAGFTEQQTLVWMEIKFSKSL